MEGGLKAAEAVLRAVRAAEQAALNAKKLAIERAKKKPVDKVNTTSNKAVNTTKKTGNPVQKNAQAKANPKGSSARSSGAGGKSSSSGSKPGGSSGASSRNNGGSSGGGGDGKADGGETYYRTMSQEDYDELVRTGRVPATRETMISPTREFSEPYEGVLVRLTVKPGTTEALAQIGVRDKSRATALAYPDMPIVSSGWAEKSAFFKFEKSRMVPGLPGQINIGLGTGRALEIFNDNLISFERLR